MRASVHARDCCTCCTACEGICSINFACTCVTTCTAARMSASSNFRTTPVHPHLLFPLHTTPVHPHLLFPLTLTLNALGCKDLPIHTPPFRWGTNASISTRTHALVYPPARCWDPAVPTAITTAITTATKLPLPRLKADCFFFAAAFDGFGSRRRIIEVGICITCRAFLSGRLSRSARNTSHSPHRKTVLTLVAKEISWSHSSCSRSRPSHSCELLELHYGNPSRA
jgi:hypothetical protein